MNNYVLKVNNDTYLKCSKRNTFAPIGLSGASRYKSLEGAKNARKYAYRRFAKVEIVRIDEDKGEDDV